MNGSDALEEGGEPEPEAEDKKVEEGEAVEPTEGGEPEVGAEPVAESPESPVQDDSAYKQRIDALEAKINDLVSTLEGLSAANKRNEEIIGSLGKRTEEKQAPSATSIPPKRRTSNPRTNPKTRWISSGNWLAKDK